MERSIESRRDFLRHASLALALPLVFGCRSDSSAQTADNTLLAAIKKNAKTDTSDQYWGARSAPADVSWRTKLATPDDEGDRIIISGTIYKPDGKAVAANTLISLYHTDVHGI